MTRSDVDVAIIGGGPAGSTAAAYLAKAGLRCAVIEREAFPRPCVGEALVPSSTRVMKEIGFIDEMDRAGFARKYASAWTTGANRPVYYHHLRGLPPDYRPDYRVDNRPGERSRPGADRDYTWNVDRAKFDRLLLGHARKLGADVHEDCGVASVDFSDPALPRLRLARGGKETKLSAKVVVDASGRQTFLGNQLRLKRYDPSSSLYSIWTWFEGYDLEALVKTQGVEAHHCNILYFLPESNAWVWQIPITDTVTSIGIVSQKKDFLKKNASRDDIFWDCIRARPELFAALRSSTQMHPLKAEGGRLYAMTRICGDGFLLVGDAAHCVDPVYAAGVSIAMNSARLASHDILRGAEKGDFSQKSFRTYRTRMSRAMKNYYEFRSLHYRLNPLFTRLIRDPRYHIDLFKIIQGDACGEERPRTLREMKRMVTMLEKRKDHPWHGLLGDALPNAAVSLTRGA